MRTVAISILLAAGAALACPAYAQDIAITPPAAADPVLGQGYSPPSDNPPSFWNDSAAHYNAIRYDVGIEALQSKNYAVAEAVFSKALRRNKDSADANFYMGVTRMDQGQWQDARQHLEIAAQKKPNHPDPKSRLGVTYTKLGDADRANALRADLVKMNDDCRDKCRLSPYIKGGIQMIDEALAETSAPSTSPLG